MFRFLVKVVDWLFKDGLWSLISNVSAISNSILKFSHFNFLNSIVICNSVSSGTQEEEEGRVNCMSIYVALCPSTSRVNCMSIYVACRCTNNTPKCTPSCQMR